MERLDREGRGEQGFMLVALVVAIFLVMLTLAVAAPRMAKELQREREVEAVHRGDQYVRAIRVYYRKNGMYPGSIEQLEKTNNVRYLRQKYVDPMTGKADWRLIHVGEAKTTVKGFFGKPLVGLPTSGAGGAGGTSGAAGTAGATGTAGAATTSAFGSSSSAFGSSSSGFGSSSSAGSTSAFGSSAGSSAFGSSTAAGSAAGSGSSAFGSAGTAGASGTGTSAGTGTGNGTGLTPSSGMPSGGAPFMGVGLPVTGESMIVLNEQTTYPTWEFIYDPRIEQLYKSSSLNGGATGANSSSFGTPAGSSAGSSAFGSGTSNSGGLFGSSTSRSGTMGSGTTGSGSTPAPTTTPAPQQ